LEPSTIIQLCIKKQDDMKRRSLVIIFCVVCFRLFSQGNYSNTMDNLKSYNKLLYPFESKWMEIDGNKIHYIDEGRGETIVFSHAVVGSSFMYREFVKDLRENYRVIIMDFPGFGLSQQSERYEFTFVEQAKIFQQFINKLQLREITLVGHDSPSGLLVATWQPHLFKAFVLTDTQIFPSNEYKRIHKLLNMAGSRFFSSFNVATNFLTWGTLKFGMPTKKFTRAEKQEYYNMTRGKIRRQAPGKILKSIRTERDAMVQLKTAFETSLSQKPTLMIYGDSDPVNKLGIPQRMKKMLPHSELHLIEAKSIFRMRASLNR
jgi:haloalkane dehalogenase